MSTQMPSPDPLIDVEKRSASKKIYPPVNSTPRNLVSRKPMMQLALDLESSNPESPDTPPPLRSVGLGRIKTGYSSFKSEKIRCKVSQYPPSLLKST